MEKKKIAIKISVKQSLDLYHGEEIRVSRDGIVVYVKETSEGRCVKDWTGKEVEGVQIVSQYD